MMRAAILATLLLAACAPHIDQPRPAPESDRAERDRPDSPPRPQPKPSAPVSDRWFPEKPGLYTRTLPDGTTETVIVSPPPRPE